MAHSRDRVQLQRTSPLFTVSFTAEHFASTEIRTQENIIATMSLAGLSVQCTATITFAAHQCLHKTIPQQVKNLVRFTGWGFFAQFLLFFSVTLNFQMVKTVNFIPVHLLVFVFTYPWLFLVSITVYLLLSFLLFTSIASVIYFFISVLASFYIMAKIYQYKFLLPEEWFPFRG